MGFIAVKKDKSVRAGHVSCQKGCVSVSYAPTKLPAHAFGEEVFKYENGNVILNGIMATGLPVRPSEMLLLLANNMKATDQSSLMGVKTTTILRMRQRLNSVIGVHKGGHLITKAVIMGKLRVSGISEKSNFFEKSISFFGNEGNEPLPDMNGLKTKNGYSLGDLTIKGFGVNHSRVLLLMAYGATIAEICKHLCLESISVRSYREDIFTHYGVNYVEAAVMASFVDGDLMITPCEKTRQLNKKKDSIEDKLMRMFHPQYVGKVISWHEQQALC